EIVVRLGRFVFRGLFFEPLVAVEWMKLAFELFRIGELAAGFEDAVLRPQRGGIRPDRFRGSGGAVRRGRRAWWYCIAVCRTQTLRDLQSGHESFEIALLFWFEIARHCLCSAECWPPSLPFVLSVAARAAYSAGTPVGVGTNTLAAARGL